MFNTLMNFFDMGGYAFYVWGAYGSVFLYLFVQLVIPWRRFQHYKREHSANDE